MHVAVVIYFTGKMRSQFLLETTTLSVRPTYPANSSSSLWSSWSSMFITELTVSWDRKARNVQKKSIIPANVVSHSIPQGLQKTHVRRS